MASLEEGSADGRGWTHDEWLVKMDERYRQRTESLELEVDRAMRFADGRDECIRGWLAAIDIACRQRTNRMQIVERSEAFIKEWMRIKRLHA